MTPRVPLEERFWAKVEKSDGCWEWTGARGETGYGHLSNGRKVCLLAHRLSYELNVGPIPDGLHIDHLCRNKSCVRPDHLEPVTPTENMRRARYLNTHCIRGHPFDSERVRMDGGIRICLECRRVTQLERRQAKRLDRRTRGEALTETTSKEG